MYNQTKRSFTEKLKVFFIIFYNRYIMKRTTIFKQLILNIVIPAVLALLILGFYNYSQTKTNIINSINTKNEIISQEIIDIMAFQDLALKVVESNLDNRMKEFSNDLVNEYLRNTDRIEYLDLDAIQENLGMDKEREDIYIINREGVVVNTTFHEDLGLNFFSFGEEHKNLLLDVFESKEFLSERFGMESNTKRLKKYTYQSTLDGDYIVELGVYSQKADEIIDFFKSTINKLSTHHPSIVDVILFVGKDNPFPLNKNVSISDEELKILGERFENQDTAEIIKKGNRKKMHYNYMYMQRENTDLYKGAVVKIVADRSSEAVLIRNELLKFSSIFGATIVLVIILLYRKTKVITNPIKQLVQKVNRITNGHFNERAEVLGNNEITTLSQKFNHMIAELESYYTELEQKVKDRTAEVVRQKEEIEIKNKHITDSIRYAKRIQEAILPPENYVKSLLPDSFILYKPKDIVSGDFYWMTKKSNKVIFTAVDCTGHGVPGAFMSIVGVNQLNYAVEVKKAQTANGILNSLNEGVIETLRESGKQENSNVKDGMDMALCIVDFKEMNLQFAGAHNPLFLIRDNELIQVPADRFAIGGNIADETPKFVQQNMDLKKGDVLYLFSDGYPDQFGGENKRKFLKKRFRELLWQIHKEPMEKQQEILDKVMEDWKGDEEQIDDIIVMGVRI